eukprot:scaffold9480_cov71-Phaeocystis_antarctica.AAC.1
MTERCCEVSWSYAQGCMHVTVAACMSQWFNVRPVLINPSQHGVCPLTRLPPTARQPLERAAPPRRASAEG